MSVVKNRGQQSKVTLFQTLADWQTMRWWWAFSAITALFMNLIAHSVFQGMMKMDPCEKCVYIRYAMFCIVLAGLITVINPKLLFLRIIGYGVTLYGAIFGAIWSWQLIESYRLTQALENGSDPFAAGLGLASCSVEPVFHFNLPLDSWLPSWFEPTGVCGADDWSFLGLNMGTWTLIIFSVYLVLIILSLIATLTARSQQKAQ